ncbi:sodium-independent anion transporter [Bermanella sp. 47_1433_sub80_T6]|nr:sodium-independent anion transporter [Bermanella sp. 47_1433_sub80_T6]
MFNLIGKTTENPKNDILSGLTVALALIPEAVAFAFVAGVNPLVGLYAAFMVGIITSIFGGRPGMISGATGAMAVVMVALVAQQGVQYLFAAVVLTGLIQMSFGFFKLGKFIRLVPQPVMLGFVNGLAIVIFLSQLGQFKFIDDAGTLAWLEGNSMLVMLALVGITMAVIHFLPKLTKAIPSALVAIVGVTLAVIFFGLDTRTVGDVADIAGGLPQFSIPEVPFTLETLWIILPYSVILAGVGLIESLLTLTLIDELTQTRGQGNRECIAQGASNTVNGFFGGMGGCAMIGQSMININSGGRGRLSGITAAVALLMFILFGSGIISQIPLAALVGVMMMVVLGTFEWSSFRILKKIPKSDAFVLILVSGITVATDLAIAVITGVIVSALVFAWKHAQHIRVDIKEEDGVKVYELHGPLFFGSSSYFLELFDPANDPDNVVIEFKYSRVADHSGLEIIDTLADRYKKLGKNLSLKHLSPECRNLLSTAGDMVEVDVIEDPNYRVATDKLA